jgi:hypothetical protein
MIRFSTRRRASAPPAKAIFSENFFRLFSRDTARQVFGATRFETIDCELSDGLQMQAGCAIPASTNSTSP